MQYLSSIRRISRNFFIKLWLENCDGENFFSVQSGKFSQVFFIREVGKKKLSLKKGIGFIKCQREVSGKLHLSTILIFRATGKFVYSVFEEISRISQSYEGLRLTFQHRLRKKHLMHCRKLYIKCQIISFSGNLTDICSSQTS